jgi:hypothetical protein
MSVRKSVTGKHVMGHAGGVIVIIHISHNYNFQIFIQRNGDAEKLQIGNLGPTLGRTCRGDPVNIPRVYRAGGSVERECVPNLGAPSTMARDVAPIVARAVRVECIPHGLVGIRNAITPYFSQ